MDQYIDKVIAEDIQFAEFVVQGKCEIDYCSGFQELLNGKIIIQISNLALLDYLRGIVKNKGARVNIAVNNCGSE